MTIEERAREFIAGSTEAVPWFDEPRIKRLVSFIATERESAAEEAVREAFQKLPGELNDLVGLLATQAAAKVFASMFPGKQIGGGDE